MQTIELKTRVIQLVQRPCQFGGLPNDNPNRHIVSFFEISDTQKHNSVPAKRVRLMLFPFSLREKAKMWKEMVAKFLTKYFQPSKPAKLRGDIIIFVQFDNESIYEA